VVSYEQFASAVMQAMRDIIDTVGDEGYRELWHLTHSRTQSSPTRGILSDRH